MKNSTKVMLIGCAAYFAGVAIGAADGGAASGLAFAGACVVMLLSGVVAGRME